MEKLQMDMDEKKRGNGVGIRHLQMILTAVCATVIYVMRSSMGVAVLAMTDTTKNSTTVEIYEWNEEIRGVVLSSFFWGYTIMQIPAGILAKKFGGQPMLLSALIINGMLCLATPTLAKFGSWIAVCLVRMAMGLTQACFMPSTHTLIGRWAPPQERTRLSMIAYAGIQIGTILTMPVCGVLSSTSLGWTLIFYTMGVLACGTAILWWGFAGSSPREHRWVKEEEREYIESSLNSSGKACPPIPWRSILTSRPLYATAIVHIGFNWTFIMFLVQMPTYLKQALGINLQNSSSLSALPFIGQWIILVISSVLSDYLINNNILSLDATRKLFNSIACVGAGIGLIVMSFLTSEHQNIAIAVMTLTGGILSGSGCGYVLNHIDLSPNFGGIMFGMTNCVANLVGILAPLSTGFILGDHPTDPARWRIVFFLAAGLIITGDLVFRFFGTSKLQAWNDAPNEYEPGKEHQLKNNTDSEKESQEIVYSFQNQLKDK
ncbi:putative inorganic phosphate cotransporter [Cydia strobilella]|uniref:putative inorganic phosphate cotransporter n=1 Tax=Cydia strobilella TaxID=1100964 RepID=UPI003005065A